MPLNLNIILGDTLGGHLDDMEADWSKPIVSLRYYANFILYFLLWTLDRNMWKGRLNIFRDPKLVIFFSASVWVAKLYFFWEESPERSLPWQCSSEVVMLYSWREKQGSAFMVGVRINYTNLTYYKFSPYLFTLQINCNANKL